VSAEVQRIALLRQSRAVGAVDLMFVADGGWRLLVEIKTGRIARS